LKILAVPCQEKGEEGRGRAFSLPRTSGTKTQFKREFALVFRGSVSTKTSFS